MTEEAKLALQYIQHTNKSVFLTGKAGTGKTTLLKKILETTHKNTIVVAPTGIAALNAGGVTIHSFFQLPFSPYIPVEDFIQNQDTNTVFENPTTILRHFKIHKIKQSIIQSLQLLVIDEVSMMRADVLDAMNTMLQHIRKNKKPFGGIQLLFIGDLWQLPPVVKQEEWYTLKKYYQSMYFFNAKVLENNPPIYIELQKVYRQSDQKFLDILNRFRNQSITNEDIIFLNQFVKEDIENYVKKGYITLTTHNYKADEINNNRLNSIDKQAYTFIPEINGDFPEKMYPLENQLELKLGAQVMFVKNDLNPEKRYFNGKIGTISYISENEIEVFFPEENQKIEVEKYEWQNIRYTFNQETKEIEEEILGTFVQYPLKLAWAITVHKSQGLTFDKAILDINDVFQSGQSYVALSRLRSLEGLILSKNVVIKHLFTDTEIISYTTNSNNYTSEDSLFQAQKEYIWNQIYETFFLEGQYNDFSHWVYSWVEETKSVRKIYRDWAIKQVELLNNINEIAKKFLIQIHSIFSDIDFRMDYFFERFHKAYNYFLPKIDQLAFDSLFVYEQSKNKKGFVLFTKELETFKEQHIQLIVELMKLYKMVKCFANNEEFSKENLKSEEVYAYKINQLIKIKELIRQQSLFLEEEDIEEEEKNNTTKKNTIYKTFELWEKNKSIPTIADQRKLSIKTIYQHIAKLVQQEKIDVTEILSNDKILQLQKIFDSLPKEATLTEIKAEAEESITWEELRIFKAYLSTK